MEEIEQLIKEINRNFGTDEWQPIQAFMENNYTQAIAGMKIYDVLLVNTIVEGMNLVAKEGPVVNTQNGVLVLSESSGAYHQLGKAALSISPTDIEGTMASLYQAIQMSSEERQERAALLTDLIQREDINHWVCTQLEDIDKLI
jgi:trehalose 6-phosphate synthase